MAYLNFDDVVLSWHKQQYEQALFDAHAALRSVYGEAADPPVQMLQQLLEQPGDFIGLGDGLQPLAASIAETGGPKPLHGLSVAEVVSINQAVELCRSGKRQGMDASLRYRASIEKTLDSDDKRARYRQMALLIDVPLKALVAYLHIQLRNQLPKLLLPLMIANERTYMLLYFWFLCNARFHPALAGMSRVRALGGYVLWFNAEGQASLLTDEPPLPPEEDEPFTLDLDTFVEDDKT